MAWKPDLAWLQLMAVCVLAACGGTHHGDESSAGGAGSSGDENPRGSAAQSGGKAGTDDSPASGSGGATNGGAAGTGAAGACNLACEKGTHCALVAVTCIRAPCPAQPMCVADAAVSCDPRKILCKRVAPECPEMQVPSVEGSCYGPCVPVEQCPCSGPTECPDADHYTCHMSAHHCGPYVR